MSGLCRVDGLELKSFLARVHNKGFTEVFSKPDCQELGREDCHWRKRIVFLTPFYPFCALGSCVLTTYFSTATLLHKAYHGGHLTIRLALGGCTNRPFYRIVAAHNKYPRDGRFVEQLGSYDPLPNSHGEKLVALNLDRIRHWIGCGAHLSKPVEKLLGLSGFFPLHPMVITNAERLRRKLARELLLASQKTDTEATETKAS
uniref:Small ribosomal subunit protein bS16m n=1 Tax=Molossus molossus TaxID=27622 RepID=A0A7J8DQG0_MOLMO|nr:mitochondrial ribosomal protein S16 [Molossus molossus]